MGFENFGTVNFTIETKAADFIKFLEQGKVMATKCRKCGKAFFPPKMDCPACMGSEVEWFEIKEYGKLDTYTVVNYGPTGFEDEAPYTLAVAGFNYGIKVLGRLSRDISDINVGMKLKVVPVKIAGEKLSFEFQKA